MKTIVLHEYERSEAFSLSDRGVKLFGKIKRKWALRLISIGEGKYILQAGGVSGMIRVDSLLFIILPKIKQLDLFYLLFRNPTYKRLLSLSHVSSAIQPSSMDTRLLIDMFLDEVTRISEIGFTRGYVKQVLETRKARGSLRIKKTVTNFKRQRLLFTCELTKLSLNIPENQVLVYVLQLILRLRLSFTFRSRVKILLHQLREVSPPSSFTSAFIENIKLRRTNQHYRLALELAKLLLDHLSLQLGSGATQFTAFLVNTPLVFEKFILYLFRRLVPRSALCYQCSYLLKLGWRSYPSMAIRMIPDFILLNPNSNEVLLVVDAKYKLLDPPGFNYPADLYQIYFYCQLLDAPRGVLIYPTTSQLAHGITLIKGIEIHILTLPVGGRPWNELDSIVLKQVASILPPFLYSS